MATTYRLASSTLVHTPGLVAWATNGCHFEDDRPQIMKVMTATYPGVPEGERAGAGCKRDAKDRAQLPVGNRARSWAAGPKKILGGPHWCQMPQIIDSRSKVLLQLTGRTVRHFHPNRQPKLTRCATRRASAMRDLAAIRCEREIRTFASTASAARGAASTTSSSSASGGP